MADSPSENISKYYDRLVEQYGHDPRACDYGSPESQAVKFGVLAEVASFADRTVLDVGCGFADFADYLESRFPTVRYHGVDLSRRMVEHALARRPNLELQVSNILDWPEDRTFDIVTANGIFYLLGDEAEARSQALITRMFAMAKTAVAFNSLSAWTSRRGHGEYYADPAQMLNFCRTLTPWVSLRHEYLEHDFSIFLYRSRPDR